MQRVGMSSLIAIMVMIAAGCGTSVPQVTPTIAPTNTPPPETRVAEDPSPTYTPVVQLDTATPTLPPGETATIAPTATGTQTPTITASPEATRTPTRTRTPRPTNTPSSTPTPTITRTPLPTDTAVPTPLPLLPTDTPTPTNTPVPSATSTPLPTNTFTPTPNIAATRNAELEQTRAAATDTPPPPPTFTAVPPASPTNTIIPPTLASTPTLITATPGGIALVPTVETVPPVVSTPLPQPDAPTATATPFTPTPFPVQQVPPTLEPQFISRDSSVPVFANSSTDAYRFDVGEGQFNFNGRTINGSVGLFVVNPADPNSFARTNTAGLLSFVPRDGSAEQVITTSPFYGSFGAEGLTAETNKNFIFDLEWSPDGRKLGFIIRPPLQEGIDRAAAGTYFWSQEYDQAYPLLRDCPNQNPQAFPSCDLVTGRPAWTWQSEKLEWSPDSQRALITLYLPSEGRGAVVIRDSIPSENPANDLTQETFWRYDSATWLNDDRLLVSGRRHSDGRVIIGTVDSFFREAGSEQIIYDASANGMWMQDAIQQPDGTVLALGKPCCPDGALRLYRIANGTATPISDFVGTAYPQRVEWSSNRAQVVLTVNGQQYVITAVNGSIEQVITEGGVAVSETAPVNNSIAPAGSNDTGSTIPQEGDPLPAGVIAGTTYDAGQQIRYVGDIPRNMRAQPNLEGALVDVVNPGEFVTILAGPYEAANLRWWLISNARNVQGWMSIETTNGVSFFSP